MKRPTPPGFVATFFALFALLGCSAANADSRTDFLVGRLAASDFRVRTNAALALGASNDDGAVTPLCSALEDQNEVVRQAAAVALKRLAKPAGAGCVKSRMTRETSASVKSQLARAIETLAAAPADDADPQSPPPRVADAKFYVSISPVTNPTGRPQADVDRVVMTAIREKLSELGAYQLAPNGETPASAKTAMSKRKLKGYYLSVGVDRFDYSGGDLRVRVKVAVFSYPTKNLRGEIPAGVTQQGVRSGDRSAEDNLMAMAAARAAELFAQNFQ